MDHLPIQRLSGFKGIGNIREGNGFGYLGIGKDDRNPLRFGSLAIGNQGKAVGSGIQDIGNTVNRVSPHPSRSAELTTKPSSPGGEEWGEGWSLEMFGLGFPEIIVILVIIFLLFGARRLPEIGESLGKTVRELRKIKEERKAEKEKGNQKKNLISDLKKEVEEIPGLKEAKEIKETADKVKNLTKFLK